MNKQNFDKKFKEPPQEYYPRPLWFWNEFPTKEKLQEIIVSSKKQTKYNGFGIVGCDSSKLQYLSDEYLEYYEIVLRQAKELNMKICLYDEWWFPSGNVCGQLQEQTPHYCAKRLDKFEYEVIANKEICIGVEESQLMSCVAMNKLTKEIINIRQHISAGVLTWQIGEQGWSIMMFCCVVDGWDRVNYLEPESVKQFISFTHEVYYERFSEYFGNVIDCAFYDEPQFYTTQGRMWSLDFNTRFEIEKGYNPELLYPSLWYDIGEKTAFARNQLFGFRAHLYANGFPRVVQEWCTKHGIHLTGHVDIEEAVNPTGITGDLMKSFQYQDIPGIDEIFERYRAANAYKIVSSAAYNWDKPLVMCESYGGMGENISIEGLYKELMEEYVKGVNCFVPHAVWTNNESKAVIFPPELSYRSEQYGKELMKLSDYAARLSYLLQGGRHIADIAVLYPIHSLHAEYYMDWGTPYEGGPFIEKNNYQELSLVLTDLLHRDFTFLHPEVLDKKCFIQEKELVLDNKVNYERYKVLLIPSMSGISSTNLEKIVSYYQNGGQVIFFEKIPLYDVDRESSEHLHRLLSQLFGSSIEKLKSNTTFLRNQNARGGMVQFLPSLDAQILEERLKAALPVPDVFMEAETVNNGILGYIHKEKMNQQIYYFMNSGDQERVLTIQLRGRWKLKEFNPADGKIGSIASSTDKKRTSLKIRLEKTSSIFLVGEEMEKEDE